MSNKWKENGKASFTLNNCDYESDRFSRNLMQQLLTDNDH